MSDFEVRTSRGSYPVLVGCHILDRELDEGSMILIDSMLEHRWPRGRDSRIAFEASEKSKTLVGCSQVLAEMHRAGLNRDSTLTAIGGGALQDVATLCSSIYMRGISWEYVPTTAMAMLDSCIGGKSSINVDGVKNLVGNIYPPKRVVVDVSAADSLSLTAKVSGLSEAVKICFVEGDSFEQFLGIGLAPDEFGSGEGQGKSIELANLSLKTKRWFVETDEFDKKERLLLNFGHTYAHAIESASGFRIPHGVAVCLGMLGALSHPLARSSQRTDALKSYASGLLSSIPDIMTEAVHLDWEVFGRAVWSDKKGSAACLRLILPGASNPVEIVEVPRSPDSINLISESTREAFAQVDS